MHTGGLAHLRLFQLISPSLPTGAFSYSQGLERAVEAGWVSGVESLMDWLSGLISENLAHLDLPILYRLRQAVMQADRERFRYWSEYFVASRETFELREEERHRAAAMTRLLEELEVPMVQEWRDAMVQCQVAPFAAASVHWGIDSEQSLLGYGYSWLETQTIAAVKLIPLGQTAGQRVQRDLSSVLAEAVPVALRLQDDELGAAAPLLSIASSQHESQYTRLFRS